MFTQFPKFNLKITLPYSLSPVLVSPLPRELVCRLILKLSLGFFDINTKLAYGLVYCFSSTVFSIGQCLTALTRTQFDRVQSGVNFKVGSFQNCGVCPQAFPSSLLPFAGYKKIKGFIINFYLKSSFRKAFNLFVFLLFFFF